MNSAWWHLFGIKDCDHGLNGSTSFSYLNDSAHPFFCTKYLEKCCQWMRWHNIFDKVVVNLLLFITSYNFRDMCVINCIHTYILLYRGQIKSTDIYLIYFLRYFLLDRINIIFLEVLLNCRFNFFINTHLQCKKSFISYFSTYLNNFLCRH